MQLKSNRQHTYNAEPLAVLLAVGRASAASVVVAIALAVLISVTYAVLALAVRISVTYAVLADAC